MQAWYQQLTAAGGPLSAGHAFSATGYSLGGHLATAFNLLNPNAAQQTVTFNGAGVGLIKQGSLEQSLADFNALRHSPEQIQARLGDSTLAGHYGVIHSHLADKSWTASQARNYLTAAYAGTTDPNGVPSGALSPRAQMLSSALDDIDTLIKEAARVPTVTGGGTEAGGHPTDVPVTQIAAVDLDYRMAVRLVAENTTSASIPEGLAQAYGVKMMLGVPAGNYTALANQYDVVGDTSPSAVSNSQWHYGQDVRVGIEDQPLYRGGIGKAAVDASLDYGDIKLLVDSLNAQWTCRGLIRQGHCGARDRKKRPCASCTFPESLKHSTGYENAGLSKKHPRRQPA